MAGRLFAQAKAQALRAATRIASDPRAQELLEDPRVHELAGRLVEAGLSARHAFEQVQEQLKQTAQGLEARDDLKSLKRALDRARRDDF